MTATRCLSVAFAVLVGVGCVESPGVGPTEQADPVWLTAVHQGISRSERQPRVVGDTITLSSRWGRLVAHVEAGGTRIAGLDAERSVDLTLRFTGWGRAGALRSVGDRVPHLGGCLEPDALDATGRCVAQAERATTGASEWWRSGPTGLQQGWTLTEEPDGAGPVVLDVQIDGATPLAATPTSARLLLAGGGALQYSGLRAWDADGADLPARLSVVGDTIRIQVEDAGARWPITVDPVVTAGSLIFNAGGNGLQFGHVGARAGDVNGDGFEDVLVASPEYGALNTGSAWIFYGGQAGPSTTATLLNTGGQTDENVGASIAALGDVNGDGFDDVAIGAPGYDGVGTDSGDVLVRMGAAAHSNVGLQVLSGPTAGEQFGGAVAGLGDVDGDGFADLGVGSPQFVSTGGTSGQIKVFFGSATGLGTTAGFVSSGSNQDQGQFGLSIAGVGDVNGDGFDDFAVGAPGQTTSAGAMAGAVHVFFGDASRSFATVAIYESPIADAALGKTVAGVGDTNGDGFADILVGAPDHDPGGLPFAGMARLLLGGVNVTGQGFDVAVDLVGGSANEELGSSLAGLGDVNGDGFTDWVVGRPGAMNSYGEAGAGVAEVHFGDAAGGAQNSVDLDVSGSTGAALGTGVIGADANGDGYSDVLACAPLYSGTWTEEGGLFFFKGGPGLVGEEPQATWTGAQANEDFGTAVAGVGDVNGDGFEDVLVGAPDFTNGAVNEGAVYGFMGGTGGLNTTFAWFFESDHTNGQLGASLDRIGDLNGDGFDDIVIGAAGASASAIGGGNVYVFYGSATGPALFPDATLSGGAAGMGLGATIVGTGDVDGDGFVDFAASAPGTGEIHGWSGGTTPPSAANVQTIASPAGSLDFAASMVGGGDINRDGYDDLVVGDPLRDNGTTGEVEAGAAHVYLGSASGLSSAPDLTIEGVGTDHRLGSDLALTDLNADGAADLVAGAPGWTCSAGADCGAVSVFPGVIGGLPSASSTLDLVGAEANAELGHAVAAVGDLDQDGFGDIVVGAPNGNAGRGRLFLYTGSMGSMLIDSGWTYTPTSANQNIGFSVAAAGDINGDFFPDVIAGGPDPLGGAGQAVLFEGNREDGVTDAIDHGGLSASDGVTLIPVRPRNGISAGDLLITSGLRSLSGRSEVAFEVEVKPLHLPFDGTGTQQSGWLDTQVANLFSDELSVSGLSGSTGYHWRARVVEDPARFGLLGHHRWVAGGTSGDQHGTHVRTGAVVIIDDDGDGWSPSAGDCDDTDASVNPGEQEICSGTDTDCDGLVDNGVVAPGVQGVTLPVAIPDGGSVQLDFEVSSDIPVSGVVANFNITHPVVGDLVLTLSDPAGDPWVLSANNGGSGADYSNTTIDWSEANPINGALAPFTGIYGPEQSLAPLVGTLSTGTWSIEIADTNLGATGSVTAMTLEVSVDGFADTDGDGLSGCAGDCDDTDGSVFLGATEIASNGIDEDCDGVDLVAETCFEDLDGDGFGSSVQVLNPNGPCSDPGFAAVEGDCDDGDATINPGVAETDCDGLDNDCDGVSGGATVDSDGDGFSACDGDCGPLDPTVVPGGLEICDGLDNDCDGGSLATELDDDGDGFAECEGDCDDANSQAWPGAPEPAEGPDLNCDGVVGDDDADGDGFPVSAGDCDDTNPAVNPDAQEVCDGADTDCDGTFLPGETQDADADGYLNCADCNALNPQVHPGAIEVCNGLDDNCDGYGLPGGEFDADGDGVLGCAGDCDDGDPDVRPGLSEECSDGIDNDCDGTVDQNTDEDGDGVGSCEGDCDDADDDVFPGATETCDGIDTDCNGTIDDGFDEDGDGSTTCAGDCLDTDATVFPGAPELCNDGLDNDCDPTTQENVDSDGDGFAPCSEPVGDCWEGNPFVHPLAEETCNHLDDNCNGLRDEGLDVDGDGFSPCDFDCDDLLEGVNPAADEVCANLLDDDCDGDVDVVGCVEDGDDDDDSTLPTDPSCGCESTILGPETPGGPIVLLLVCLGVGAARRRER